MLDDWTSDNSGHIFQLEARVHRMEAMMEALLIRLGIDPAEVTPPEPQENRAIREAFGKPCWDKVNKDQKKADF